MYSILMKSGTNFRLCKGIYNEEQALAYKQPQEIRDNYLNLLRIILENGCYAGIATHDDYLINGAYELIEKLGLKKNHTNFKCFSVCAKSGAVKS